MRTLKGSARRKATRKLLNRAKGFVGGRRKLLRTAKETLVRAGVFAFRDRRVRKREFRRLWIMAGAAQHQRHQEVFRQFNFGLIKANISLDRKQLSELAIHDPAGFQVVVEQVKAALAS